MNDGLIRRREAQLEAQHLCLQLRGIIYLVASRSRLLGLRTHLTLTTTAPPTQSKSHLILLFTMSTESQTPVYKLIYPAPFPGRGEHIRLLLEEAGIPYTEGTVEEWQTLKSPESLGDDLNTPLFAPPFLQYGDLTISQTPNILQFLAKQFDLAGDPKDQYALYRINGLALTALDGLSNEVHDCHHPLGGNFYYEDAKDESLKRSRDYLKSRLPAFLGYLERVLQGKASGEGVWLHGDCFTYADLVLFQVGVGSHHEDLRLTTLKCLDGTKHQFPNAVKQAENSGQYDRVFKLYQAVQERPKIKAYLQSDRRLKYGNGVYRHYPELDVDSK